MSNKELLGTSLEVCENKFVFWGAPSALTLHEQSSGPVRRLLQKVQKRVSTSEKRTDATFSGVDRTQGLSCFSLPGTGSLSVRVLALT